MDEVDWDRLREALDEWKRGQFPYDTPSFEQWVIEAHEHFTDLVEHVESAASIAPSPPQRDMVTAIAVLAFGPQGVGDAPAEHWRALLDVVGQSCPSRAPDVEAVIEVVIAWGCGWGRAPSQAGNKWDQRWIGAVLVLIRMVEAASRWAVLRLLMRQTSSETIRSWAELIAVELMKDRCQCGQHVKACKEKKQHLCCRPEHKLSSWDPGVARLRAFLAQAVRGSAKSSLQAGAFSVSMLYPVLQQDYGLRVATAEFKICHNCHADLIADAVRNGREPEIGKLEEGLYEGHICPKCGQPARAPANGLPLAYHRARTNWLIIPYDNEGPYMPVQRKRCPRCENLYEPGLAACPYAPALHEARHALRLSIIWVRGEPRVELEEEAEGQEDELYQEEYT